MKDCGSPHLNTPPGSSQAPPLGRKALGGVVWNWSGSAMLVIAQIASTAATARLVAPREFGLYATAQAAAGIAGYFTMRAIGNGLLRRSQLDEKTVGTALTLSLAASFIVSVALWFGAPLWARAWGLPDSAGVVRVFAIVIYLTGAAAVPVALIHRQLRFGRAAIIETGAQVIALALGVALAIELRSALALALGQAVGAAVLFVGAAAMVREQLRLSFDRVDARELFAFAGQVSALDLGMSFAYTAPAWFTARTFGASVLGLYSRANLVVSLPLTYVSQSITRVLYPLYGHVREDLRRTRILLDEALTLSTGLAWPVFAMIAGASPVIVEVLLGPRWSEAAPLLALFALTACGNLPSDLLTNAAQAFGWMRIIAMRLIAFSAGAAGAMGTVHLAGLSPKWLLVGIAASQWITYLLTLQPFIRRRYLDSGLILRKQLVHAAVAVGAFGASASCAKILAGAALPIQVGGQAAVAAVVAGAILLRWRWFPATRVLGRRIGVAPGESIARAMVAALR